MHIISRLSYILLSALAIAGCVQNTSSDIKRSRTIDSPNRLETPDTSPDTSLKAVMIDTHNAARKEVGTPSLVWDENLANNARKYAIYLAKNNIFEHDPQKGVAVRQGENLWMGTRGAFSYAVMADGWISEKRFYKKGIFPNNSNSGKWTDVGHYTQIIWRSTTHVGCAVASNRQNDFLVCRYNPAGNYFDQDPLNN